MPFTKTPFEGLYVFDPVVFRDSRGYFFESYSERTWELEGISIAFIQDNQAKSSYGVVRGLHYQLNPHAQTKLVRVLCGSILDVVVDIRKGSPTYGKHFAIELTAENFKQLLVPQGFAHGYAVLSETAEVLYKCDAFYDKAAEAGISYNDPFLNIDWMIPTDKQIISEKDKHQPLFSECITNFEFNK